MSDLFAIAKFLSCIVAKKQTHN